MENENLLTSEEFLEYAMSFEKHHAIFYRFWSLGTPIFTEDVKTAAIKFDETGDYIEFLFNPTFWKSLTKSQRLFVIGHECLHTILNHGFRMLKLDKEYVKLANNALDIVVNHSLVNNFGFNRLDFDPDNKYCWVDTVFTKTYPDDKSFEFYFRKLIENQQSSNEKDTVDDHENLHDSSALIDKLNDECTPEEKQTVKKFINEHFPDKTLIGQNNGTAGTSTDGKWMFVNVGKVDKKYKWETIVNKWVDKTLKTTDKECDQWVRINRRAALIKSDMFIPSTMEVEVDEYEKEKLNVFFFLDVSYSCVHLKERFFKAAKSIPENRFNIRLFSFDTSVKEVDINGNKLYGGGGTDFHIIENKIQEIMKNEKITYPSSVWIITDGDGNAVNPQKPDRWHWFLESPYNKTYIPSTSKIFKLKDFE